MHNGNIDKYALVVLDHLGIISLEDLTDGLVTRKKPGRKRALADGLTKEDDGTVSLESRIVKLRKLIKAKTNAGATMWFSGHRIMREWGGSECVALIRRYIPPKGKRTVGPAGEPDHKWNVYYYMDKGGPNGDNEDLTLEELAVGMAKAHHAGCGGPVEAASV